MINDSGEQKRLKRSYQYVRRVNAVMRATTMTTTILKSANTNIHTKVGIDISKADVTKIILFFKILLLRTFVYERATLRLREEKKQKKTHGQQGPIIQFILLDEST